MPNYRYECESCGFVHDVFHKMSEDPDVPCPECQNACFRTFNKCTVTGYIRGYGMARDKAGAKRDQNLHTLLNGDPYATHRERGEADDLADRLRKGGKHNPNTKYFT
jgi:putative FmdB family regulatory protein